MIKVLLADDQQLMREGIGMLLELEDDIALVAEASDGLEATTAYQQYQPDVVLMDIEMPTQDGIEATEVIIANDPAAKVLILTTFGQEDYVRRALLAGASGFLLKAVSGAELAGAIRRLYRGESVLDGQSTEVLLQSYRQLSNTQLGPQGELLTARELEILNLIAEHMSNRDIAHKLHLAEGTVKNYISQILDKLQVSDRKEAVEAAKAKFLLK